MAVIQKLCKEIADKIREEKLYPEDIIKTVEGLKPSEEFVNFVSLRQPDRCQRAFYSLSSEIGCIPQAGQYS